MKYSIMHVICHRYCTYTDDGSWLDLMDVRSPAPDFSFVNFPYLVRMDRYHTVRRTTSFSSRRACSAQSASLSLYEDNFLLKSCGCSLSQSTMASSSSGVRSLRTSLLLLVLRPGLSGLSRWLALATDCESDSARSTLEALEALSGDDAGAGECEADLAALPALPRPRPRPVLLGVFFGITLRNS